MKIRQMGAGLFHADARTDGHITRLTVAFRNISNAPNNMAIEGADLPSKLCAYRSSVVWRHMYVTVAVFVIHRY
jgi:hypothetical protein